MATTEQLLNRLNEISDIRLVMHILSIADSNEEIYKQEIAQAGNEAQVIILENVWTEVSLIPEGTLIDQTKKDEILALI